MHLFIIHQFPDLDNLAPIIKTVADRTKVRILSLYPVYDFKLFKILKFLLKHNVEYEELSSQSYSFKFLKILLKIINFLPIKIIRKFNFLWRFIYYKNFLINKNFVYRYLIKNKFISVNVDDALPKNYCKFFYEISNKLNINFVTYKNGVDMKKNKKLDLNKYKFFNKFIIQDNHYLLDQNQKNRIVKSSHRYSKQWLEYSENAYDYKMNDYLSDLKKKRNLRVAILTRSLSSSLDKWGDIFNIINSIDGVEVKIKYKPRGNLAPIHSHHNFHLDYSTSELVNWCDLIVSHTSSVLAEAMIKKKKIFFLRYLTKLNEELIIDDYNYFTEIVSDKHLVENIKNFQRTSQDDINYDDLLYKLLGNDYKNKDNLEKLIDKIYY